MPDPQDAALSIAVMGCGHWGPNHIRAFSALPGARVTWAVETDADRRQHMATRFRDLRVTHRLGDILDDPSVDAVVISTPAATHAPLALAALRAGKHVLCEKPLGVSAAECRTLVSVAAAEGFVLMTGHVFLFNPAVLAIKRLIDSGALGRVCYATAERASPGPIRTDVDAAWDLASHEISIFNFLFDAMPTSVSATGRAFGRPGVHDVVAITLAYPNDVMASLMVSWLHPRKVRQLSIVGEARMVTFDDLAARPLTIHRPATEGRAEPYYDSYGEFRLFAGTAEVTQPAIAPAEPLKEQARHFLEAITTGDAGRADGTRGWDVVTVLEAVSASILRKGAPIDIEARLAQTVIA